VDLEYYKDIRRPQRSCSLVGTPEFDLAGGRCKPLARNESVKLVIHVSPCVGYHKVRVYALE